MRLRTWFLRDVVDAIEREHAGDVQDRLKARLPERLAEHLDSSYLHGAAPTDTISLDDGEELLLAVDTALGNGSGSVLEEAANGLATRVLSQGGGVVVLGDLLGTMRRMRAPLERPFVNVDLVYQLTETDTGFSLTLGIAGRPRSARMLRYLGVGTIRAAHRFSRETDEGDFKLYAEVSGDRANISARYRQPVSQPGAPEEAPTPSRRPSRRMRSATQPRLAAEVERILGHAASAPPPDEVRRRPSTMPPPGTSPMADVSPASVPPAHSPSGVRARTMIDRDDESAAGPESGTGSAG